MRAKTRLLSCVLAGALFFSSCTPHARHEAQVAVATTTTSTTSTTVAPTTTTVPVTTTTIPPTTTTTVPFTETYLYQAWSKVAVCEEGGWIGYAGRTYPDSLGITAANWYQFGGGSDVSPAAQIAVAERLIHFYGASIPDQNGCQRGGW